MYLGYLELTYKKAFCCVGNVLSLLYSFLKLYQFCFGVISKIAFIVIVYVVLRKPPQNFLKVLEVFFSSRIRDSRSLKCLGSVL